MVRQSQLYLKNIYGLLSRGPHVSAYWQTTIRHRLKNIWENSNWYATRYWFNVTDRSVTNVEWAVFLFVIFSSQIFFKCGPGSSVGIATA